MVNTLEYGVQDKPNSTTLPSSVPRGNTPLESELIILRHVCVLFLYMQMSIRNLQGLGLILKPYINGTIFVFFLNFVFVREPTLTCVASACPFSLLSIPLHGYTTFCLCLLPVMGTSGISNFSLV